MNNLKKINTVQNDISLYQDKLLKFKDIINNSDFLKLENIKNTFINDSKSKLEENRLLRIGIIGQIKRGKSSFLNALLFNGQDILPKGATPMTAALTKIHYSDKPYAKISYYSKQDWENIRQIALETLENEQNEDFEGEISQEAKSCLDIYQKAKSTEVLEKLDGSDIINNITKVEDLLKKLENYVGADGEFTPIVKSLELGVNVDSIKDIEIIDTPGTNDPIVSRGRITQDFIGQCDVVFFLSLSSQFLDQNDMELLAQNMPNKGIKNIFLVGSLFDSAMLDTYNDYDNAADLISNLKYKYEKRAKEDIEKIIDSQEDNEIVKSLKKALPPIFISGMCFNIANNFDNLSEEEQHILNNLNFMYDDDFEQDDLFFIANIEEVQEKITLIKSKKDEILKSAFEDVVNSVSKQINALQKEIDKNAKTDFEMLKNNDLATLEKKQLSLQNKIKKSESKINNVFEGHIIKIEKGFASLLHELKSVVKSAEKIKIDNGVKTENYSVVTNHFFNFFNDNWGRESRTKTINYKYANLYQTIEQIEGVMLDSEKMIFEAIANIIDIKLFRKEIMNNIIELFDLEDDDFEPTDIINILGHSVNRITIPKVDLDSSKHIDIIRNSFSSTEVKGEGIDKLKKETKQVLSLIINDIRKELDSQMKKIILELNQAKNNFLPQLLKDSKDKLEVLKNNLKEFEKTENKYKELFKLLEKE